MDQSVITSIIRSAGNWAFVIVLGLAGFFARQWFRAQELAQTARDKAQEQAQTERDKAQADRDNAMKEALGALATGITKLNETLVTLGESNARHDERIQEHDRQLKGIWDGKNCLNEGCPLRSK